MSYPTRIWHCFVGGAPWCMNFTPDNPTVEEAIKTGVAERVEFVAIDSVDIIDWRPANEHPKPDCVVDLLLFEDGRVFHGHSITDGYIDYDGNDVNPSHWALWPKGPKVVT